MKSFTQDRIPEVPSGLKLTQINYNTSNESDLGPVPVKRNILTWNSSKEASSYKIFKSKSRYGKFEEIGETSTTTFIDEDLQGRSQFENVYKIQAVNGNSSSDFSEPHSRENDIFGDNFIVFTKNDDPTAIHNKTTEIYAQQKDSQFGENRYVLAYKHGDYSEDKNLIDVGYYTQIMGLGQHPNDVALYNIHCPAALPDNNATCNFWCGITNLTVKDLEDNDDPYFDFTWSVSQAAPARRLNVFRKGHFDWYYGWASGGYIADCWFHKQAGSFPQQQYFYRNNQVSNSGLYGINWNNVVHGCTGVTKTNSSDNSNKPWTNSVDLKGVNGYTNWYQRGCSSVINSTEIIREKPFLFYDKNSDRYKVCIPSLRKNASGLSWDNSSPGTGAILDVEKSFYVARPDKDTADSINIQLARGKNIILCPGIYRLGQALRVIKPNIIIMGLGFATLIPESNDPCIICSDVGGLSINGIIFDAGPHSESLLLIGNEGCNKDHSDNPSLFQDIFFRVGGTGKLATCDSCLVINSNNVIVDHTWIWRADHGDQTGWDKNLSKNGAIINGDNVIFYGFFCEHFQEYDIIWRGENGKTYFLQNEKCYDPQKQETWMSHDGTKKGFAAYKVCNNVKTHYALGLGVYDVFINTGGASIYLDNAIEVPNTSGVLIENATIVELSSAEGPKVGCNHIINGTGFGIRAGQGQSPAGFAVQKTLSYSNGTSFGLEDYYYNQEGEGKVTETGESPTYDKYAEKDIVKEASSKDSEKHAWEVTDDDYKIIKGEKKNIPLMYCPQNKCLKEFSSFKEANENMNEVMEKVNNLVIKKIDEKKNGSPEFNAFSETAKKNMKTWTQYVSKHTEELTKNIEEKLKEYENQSPLKKCSYCNKYPIKGIRYECFTCHGLCICQECEEKYGEQHEHPFIKYYSTSQKK